jgi:nucleoside 2-deoxyribosyltransferase
MSTLDLIYLASPYSHPDPAVRQIRYEVACEAAAYLMRRGLMVFSPIVHSHPIAQYGLPKDYAFWRQYDEALMDACWGIVVLMIDGWRESKGVTAEIEYMSRKGIAAEYLDPEDMVNSK